MSGFRFTLIISKKNKHSKLSKQSRLETALCNVCAITPVRFSWVSCVHFYRKKVLSFSFAIISILGTIEKCAISPKNFRFELVGRKPQYQILY